jgi:hypothetical protein
MDFALMLKMGLIPLSILDKKVYYERYLHELTTVNKSQAITNTSEEYNVHENTIRNAVNFMESC